MGILIPEQEECLCAYMLLLIKLFKKKSSILLVYPSCIDRKPKCFFSPNIFILEILHSRKHSNATHAASHTEI